MRRLTSALTTVIPIHLIALATTLAVGGWSAQAADLNGDKDLIYRKNSGVKMLAYIENETDKEILFRTLKPDPSQKIPPQLSKLKLSEFDHAVYNGMESGSWKKGMDEKEAGNLEAAADNFNQLSSTGAREWEKVYGALAEGECWELAKKYDQAAKAFATVVDGYAGNPTATPPQARHRLWLDAKYRLGINLALAKDVTGATKAADDLEAIDKKESLAPASARANAIRAAIAANDANLNKFKEFTKKATLRPFDEKEAWFHFKLFCAETFRQTFQQNKDAAVIYREILGGLGDDPARASQISLGLGLCLIDSDKPGALIELTKLDVMPYGTADQKCEARMNTGKLLMDIVQGIKNNPEQMKDEKKASYAKETERAARLILSAAADGPSTNASVAKAKDLLIQLGPDPDEKKDEKKDDKPAADANK